MNLFNPVCNPVHTTVPGGAVTLPGVPPYRGGTYRVGATRSVPLQKATT